MRNRLSINRLACIALVAAGLFFAWTHTLDARAEASVDAGLKRALASFAIARTLNAVISVAQGTEVSLQPAGVGLVLTPGQLLAPADRLVEQFGSLMFAATVAFGVMKMLILLGQQALFAWLLSGVALLWAALLLRREGAPRVVTLMLVGLLFARFALPVSTLSGDWVFERLMKPSYESSQQAIHTSAPMLESAADKTAGKAAPPPSTVDRIRDWFASSTQSLDPTEKYRQLRALAEGLVEHTVQLVVVFLMQTLVIPLLTLWALKALAVAAYRAAARRPTAAGT